MDSFPCRLKWLNEGLINQVQVESIKCRLNGSNIINAGWMDQTFVKAIPCRSKSIFQRLLKRMMAVVLFLPSGEEYWYTIGVLQIKTLSLEVLTQYVFYSDTDVVLVENNRKRTLYSLCARRSLRFLLLTCCADSELARQCTPAIVNKPTDENRKNVMKAVALLLAQTNVRSETEVVITSPKLYSY